MKNRFVVQKFVLETNYLMFFFISDHPASEGVRGPVSEAGDHVSEGRTPVSTKR